MNFASAIEFVRRNGDEVELARLEYLLTKARPAQDVIAKLLAGQRKDGGWAPFWADDYSSLDATCFRLAQAEQLGLANTEPGLIRTVHFLMKRQSMNGSWEESQEVAALAPPWAMPGDLSAKLYLTANCGLWLALSGNPENKASEAGAYLQTYMYQDGHLPSFLHAHWLAAGLWHKLNWQEPAGRVSVYLDQRIGDLAPSNLAWLITTLLAAGVTPDHLLVEKAVSLLELHQHADGRWQSEDGPRQDVHTTLEAMRAVWLSGRIAEDDLRG